MDDLRVAFSSLTSGPAAKPGAESPGKFDEAALTENAPAVIRKEVIPAAERAVAAGAHAGSLKYVGAGAEGIVFEDQQGRAYKVGRHANSDALRAEADALKALQGGPAAKYAPKFHGYDAKNRVLARDKVEGRSGNPSDNLWDAHKAISAALKAQEFTAPEFKENSYVMTADGPKIVDIGFVHPTGKRAAAQLKGRMADLTPKDDLFDLQFEISSGYGEGAVTADEGQRYFDVLEQTFGKDVVASHRREFDSKVKHAESTAKSLRVWSIDDLVKAKKLHYRCERHGLPISIENRKGSFRHWFDTAKQKPGRTRMKHPYGYLRGTEGADGDELDVFVGPDKDGDRVFIVNQRRSSHFGRFDEHKVILCVKTLEAAKQLYLANYDSKGPRLMGAVREWSIPRFKRWLRDGDTKSPVRKSGPLRFVIPGHLVKSGGPFIGPRGGKWADATHTIPWKEPAVAFRTAATSDAEFRKRLAGVEAEIRHHPVEHGVAFDGNGKELFHAVGERDRLVLTKAQKRQLTGVNGVLTHNHPESGTLGASDISLAISTDCRELRAVGPDGVVLRILRPTAGWGKAGTEIAALRTGMYEAEEAAVQRAMPLTLQRIREAAGTPAASAPRFNQEVWNEFRQAEIAPAVAAVIRPYGLNVIRSNRTRRRDLGKSLPVEPRRVDRSRRFADEHGLRDCVAPIRPEEVTHSPRILSMRDVRALVKGRP